MKALSIAVAAAALPLMSGASSAKAACTLSQFIAPGISATYDPFDASFTAAPMALTARTAGDCKGSRIQLALAPTPTSPQTGTGIHLRQGASDLVATLDAGGQSRPVVSPGAAFLTNPLSLPIGSAGEITGSPTLQVNVAAGQVAPPGSYSAILSLLGRVTDNAGHETETSTPLVITVTVKPSVRIAVGAGDLAIDLGELKPGLLGGPVNFDAYANVDYNLLVRSDNGFVMRPGGRGAGAGVPYAPMISGGTISAAGSQGGTQIQEARFDAPSGGLRRHALRVKVGNFPNLSAGQYSDVMTVEIRARV